MMENKEITQDHKQKDCQSPNLYELTGKVLSKKQWMVVAWVVEDGKIKMVDRITHRFPTDDFLVAIGQLANNCHEEKLKCGRAEKEATPREELPSDPLPQAEVFKMPVVENTNSGLAAEPTIVEMAEETAGCKIRADALRNVDFYDTPLLDEEGIVSLPKDDENKSPEDEQQ